MIQDTLPYLLELVRKNILLHTLVISGNYHNVNLKGLDYQMIGKALLINNLLISNNDSFDIEFYVLTNGPSTKNNKDINLSLTTRESKYFDNSAFYFNDDENRGINKHPLVREQRKRTKDLGVFKIFDDPVPPAFVSIVSNPVYGYSIFITFYSDFKERYERKRAADDAIESDVDSFLIKNSLIK